MTRILLVEDEEIMADLIEVALEEDGHQVYKAYTIEQAKELFREDISFDAIILDRQLPDGDSIEMVKELRDNQHLCNVPLIFNTTLGHPAQIREGAEVGAFWYLTKPMDPHVLRAVIANAIDAYKVLKKGIKKTEQLKKFVGYLQTAKFSCKTIDEARELAEGLSVMFAHPDRAIFGLTELLVNAVEHGNLAICYSKKTEGLLGGYFDQMIAQRMGEPPFNERIVRVTISQHKDMTEVKIEDEGEGFDWQDYLEIAPERLFDPNGRGIAMTNAISFDHLEYLGKGNIVVAKMLAM